MLDVLLERCRDLGLLKARGRQRTDSTHVLAAVRALSRLERVRETLRNGLDVLAVVAPDWLRAQARSQWAEHSRHRSDKGRLPPGQQAQRELADQIGRDGTERLSAISAEAAPAWLWQVPAVERLRRLWVQNSRQTDQHVRFRTPEDGFPPSAQFSSSPYDGDAHLATKGSTCWVGSKGAVTETSGDEVPNLITHVETTSAPTADGI